MILRTGLLLALAAGAYAKKYAWFYSGDNCDEWNSTLSSTKRNMDGSHLLPPGYGCVDNQLKDPNSIPPRKYIWLPKRDKGRPYCLHLFKDTGCPHSDCGESASMDLILNADSKGCHALPEGAWQSFMFFGGEDCATTHNVRCK